MKDIVRYSFDVPQPGGCAKIHKQVFDYVVSSYFGLNAGHAMTLEEIGEKFDLTRERVRQIKEKAVRRLKHTTRSKILKTYLG